MTGSRPVAIITGGRRGIGLGIARALADDGFDIAVTGLGPLAPDDGVLAELEKRGVAAAYFEADLSDVAGHAATVEKIMARFGRIDCLVNNAGMGSVVRGDFLDLTPENFDRVVATNLRGTVFFTQAVVRAMLASNAPAGGRTIVNITSVSAELTSPERLDYCVSKAGLSSFGKGLALYLAEKGIAVFEIRPGIIRTDMTAGVAGKYDALIADGLVPMRRWGEPDDIGGVVSALASGRFAFATGSVIDLDGGLSIGRL
ncbi:3-ketoacyl-ACP reductase [Rhizobium sp. S-51]|uniref:3-ketoacyl-ACP reductase n=1 Tax=Rhizobium terricola TaxID=2728849 RepID=A0A7Y0AXN5_9HYPH|nr:3-ketoacyl-ACP reductase [Rhizobium terricola]NML75393.1 3-ketoacyl-ACP reductase [Rhizobium terricola]